MQVVLTVTDFREIGRTMTYYTLCEVLRGIGEFTLAQGPPAREVSFEVEVEKLGYLGTGHVDYRPIPPEPSVSSTAVA